MTIMDTELETNFDVIVLGTGFVESLIAAASARIGKKVLHIDRNDYYGGQWASFSITGLEYWISSLADQNEFVTSDNSSKLLQENESIEYLSNSNDIYYGIKNQWHIPDDIQEESSLHNFDASNFGNTVIEGNIIHHKTHKEKGHFIKNEEKEEVNNEIEQIPDEGMKIEGFQESEALKGELKTGVGKVNKVWCKEDLLKLKRKFNIDLSPKILFAKGPLVELLISSNVARYLEFKCISRILTWIKSESEQSGHFVVVPCSRSDVFTSDVIGLVEKRILMKFLQFCIHFEEHEEEWKDYAEKPFKEFLEFKNLTPSLVHFVTSSIGMVDGSVETLNGLQKTAHFLKSLNRYGAMPFLFSIYGAGEMPQAFCRLCAIFEGVYILRREVEGMILNSENVVCGIMSNGQKFHCKNFVADASYAPQALKKSSTGKKCISRGIFVTDRTIMESEKEHLSLLRMPIDDNNAIPVTIIEVGPSTGVTPLGTYLVHFSCDGEDAEKDFKVTKERIFSDQNEQKPNILFSLYFNQNLYEISPDKEKSPSNVYYCSGPDCALDYDSAIAQAKFIFTKMFPNEEFLPRAPDPEEIVFDGETSSGAENFDEEGFSVENKVPVETGLNESADTSDSFNEQVKRDSFIDSESDIPEIVKENS